MTIGNLITFIALFGFSVVVLPLIFVLVDDAIQQKKWEKELEKENGE